MYLNFERELELVKSNINNKDINKVLKDIQILNNYIRYMKNKGFSKSEILQDMNEDIIQTHIVLTQNLGTERMQREFYTLGILINNPTLLEKIYKDVKDTDLSNFNIRSEQEQSDGEENIWQNFIVKLNLKFLRDIGTDKQEGKQNEETLLVQYMTQRRKDIEEELKRRYIELLLNAGHFMEKYQFLKNKLERYNQEMVDLSLENLQYPLENKDKEDPNDLSMEELFSQEYLQNLKLEDLAVLNFYWQNRLTKNLESIINGLFMKKNVRLKKRMNPKEVLTQYIYKKQICANIYNQVAKRLQKDKKYIKYDLTENPDFIEEYNKYFNEQLSVTNTDFLKDVNDISIYENVQKNAYKVKDNMIKMLLQTTLKSGKVTNWGIIEEKRPTEDNFLIGIDFPGFNFPVKAHIEKNELKGFIENINGNTILPIYKGYEDFTYRGKSIIPYIFAPLTKQKEGTIIKKITETKPIDLKYIIYQHFGNLITTKSKKVKKIYSEKYMDLESGKQGRMINGDFVEDPDYMQGVQGLQGVPTNNGR